MDGTLSSPGEAGFTKPRFGFPHRGGTGRAITGFVPCLLELQMYANNSDSTILPGWRWLYEPQVGVPHHAGRYRPGGPPFSSSVCWSCRCIEVFVIRGWGLILPGWRWLYEPQLISDQPVGLSSTPDGAVSTQGTTVFVPGMLELYMHGMIYDPGI